MKRRILFVVKGYYPDLSPSGNLVKPLVEELSKNNFVYVLSWSGKSHTGQYTKNLHFKKIELKKSGGIFFRLLGFLKRNFGLKIYDNNLVNKMKLEIESLDREYNFDSIIAVTFEEILALMYSRILAKKKSAFLLEKIPLASNIKVPFLYPYRREQKVKIEEEIMDKFNSVFVLPIMYKYFSQNDKYKNKTKLVELEHPMVVNNISSKKSNNKVYKLIYAGGLDRNQRNPLQILNFFLKVSKVIMVDLKFYSYGNMQNSLYKFASANSFFSQSAGISADLLKKEIDGTDFIVTIGNKESDIVPSKIFDCISTGKPIIHFAQIAEDPYKKYLDLYPNSIMVNVQDLSEDETVSKIVSFMEKNYNNQTTYKYIYNNFYECTPEYVGRKLLDILQQE
ncbi:hypothetical protein [Bacillus coreaensis]